MTLSYGLAVSCKSAPTPAGPWTGIPGAASPYYTVVTAQQQYFQVRN